MCGTNCISVNHSIRRTFKYRFVLCVVNLYPGKGAIRQIWPSGTISIGTVSPTRQRKREKYFYDSFN